ncbi:hypothetical protein [Agrobacterium cavarae]|uniref:hypothetical protein n=1 Tax=Agrobacterium cavarae TaxID=2528239 RepID=UPI002FFB868E
MNAAIPYVTSGLTLVAFIAATIAYVWRANLKSAERRIESAPAENRQQVIETVAEWIGVDLQHIPQSQRAAIVLKQLELKADRQRQLFALAVIGSVLFFILSAIVVFDGRWRHWASKGDVADSVSAFTQNTPPELIQSVLGIPTSVRGDTTNGEVFYADDDSGVYVGDYRRDGKRIGLLFLSLEKPIKPFPLQKPLRDITLAETLELCDGLGKVTARANLQSTTCGGFGAVGSLYYRFFFRTDELAGPDLPDDYDPERDPCSIWKIKAGFDLKKCPLLAKWPPVAVAISNDSDDLEEISIKILEDFDFGTLFI